MDQQSFKSASPVVEVVQLGFMGCLPDMRTLVRYHCHRSFWLSGKLFQVHKLLQTSDKRDASVHNALSTLHSLLRAP